MRELLRLKADACMELHFEPLAGIRLDPLAVDALILVFRPGVLEFMQFKALAFQAFDVSSDTLSVVRLAILKGVTDRVRYI